MLKKLQGTIKESHTILQQDWPMASSGRTSEEEEDDRLTPGTAVLRFNACCSLFIAM